MNNRLSVKHILGVEQLTLEDIRLILDTAEALKEILDRPIKKVPPLRGSTVVTLFFEPSTRTRLSFELAAKRLSADTVSVSAATSSVLKGETLLDTVKNVEAMRPDILVVRHSSSGAPHFLARHLTGCSVINAGDGINQHPTQALLDLFTVRERLGRVKGLKIAILGDILHSRVAHSDIRIFKAMGAHVFVSGPASLLPIGLEALGACVTTKVEEALASADVVMLLRLQKERQGRSLIPSEREYANFFGLVQERCLNLASDAILMHPGPINRGVELTSELADSQQSVILNQVTNGVAVRMAILSLLWADRS
jgi:aspartate carbamoyltransferase catalytic subunit